MDDLTLIKNQLTGANLKRLLKSKKLTKYRVHKDPGISYQTLCMWQGEKVSPSDELTKRAGIYLGLITSKDQLLILKNEVKELQRIIEKLEQGG